MTKNVTLRVDEEILRKCRHAAVEQDKSLSQWVIDLLRDKVAAEEEYSQVRERAVIRMRNGYDLGGRPLSREEAHER